MTETITFYRIGEPFGCFSNFAPYPVEIDGLVWPTTEHYYQAQKFADPAYRERIRHNKYPSAAKGQGNNRTMPIRPDWDEVRVEVMRKAVRAKLAQHPDVAETLRNKDPFWTDGGDGSGANTFGRLLMELRAELRAAQTSLPVAPSAH